MHRRTLDVLRCPACLAGSLVPEDAVAQPAMSFGPVHCVGCRERFPVIEGLLDVVTSAPNTKPLQRFMERPWVARSWERYVRPAVDSVLGLALSDREAEYAAIATLLGNVSGPLLDVGCGAGAFVQRFVRDGITTHAIGVDASRPMLDEALAHVRENALSADFVRAQVPPLPVLRHALAAITATGVVHAFDAHTLDALLLECARVLRPKARLVLSTFAKRGRPNPSALGVHLHTEDTLRRSCERAGFIREERVVAGNVVVLKFELP